ncbi:putative SKP1-like protein 3 [Cocos nucifera]|uniref:Putative SKP1-like protein 3 n=1 Tax=Cocos nucifera TaxID=13894 RepID=A0A8K0I5V3_COCNU|nr:putative SKP1-like protein 3 [Cocos nucifera]
MDSLLAVIGAAYHLKCKPLAMLACQALLDIIKDFSDMDRFEIELSYTAEEKRGSFSDSSSSSSLPTVILF